LQWSYWCGGFCFGGWIANMMAINQIVCRSSVLWTTHSSQAEKIKRLSVVCGFRHSRKWRVGLLLTILKKNKLEHTAYFYEGESWFS
jgi:carboxymethylenebutenolidase